MATEFSNLPEGCVANVISLTDPREACSLTLVSTLFRTAADSDAVWERFLPPDHQRVIAQSDVDTQNLLLMVPSKKHLFMRLADSPIIIDIGRKSFFLEKASGKKCFMISAREMDIEWGDTPIYWYWISVADSRFSEVTQLRQVRWLKISLKIETSLLTPKTTYISYLVFKLTDDNRGFDHTPVETSVGIADGVKNTRTVFLGHEDGADRQFQIVPRHERFFLFNRYARRSPLTAEALSDNNVANGQYPKRRADGWMEAELGEVFVDGGDNGDLVEVSVTEVKGGHWKQGMVIEGIEFRPKA